MSAKAEEPNERTTLLMDDGKTTTFEKRRFRIIKDQDGERSLNMVIGVEDFRLCFYLSIFFIFIVAYTITTLFSTESVHGIIESVYGGLNFCIYFDFPPSTYVLPIIWCLSVIFGFLYSISAIYGIVIAHLENKLSKTATVLLVIAYCYINFSICYMETIFSVSPDRKHPETMTIHTAAYLNFKMMLAVLQVAVVYFGIKVAWVGLKLPKWFIVSSVMHAVILVVLKVAAFIWIMNALLDMGEKELEGKGKWWSVRSDASVITGWLFVNIGGMVGGIFIPFLQSLYICRYGVHSHALVVNVSDNRMSATTE